MRESSSSAPEVLVAVKAMAVLCRAVKRKKATPPLVLCFTVVLSKRLIQGATTEGLGSAACAELPAARVREKRAAKMAPLCLLLMAVAVML